jgi:hypothetical protein
VLRARQGGVDKGTQLIWKWNWIRKRQLSVHNGIVAGFANQLALLGAGADVTVAKVSWCRAIGIVFASAALSACGEHISSHAPSAQPSRSAAQAKSDTQCFFAVGPLTEIDAQLFAASGAGDVSRIEQSIAAGASINATDALKRTPLFAAAFCNHPQTINLLIDRGSEVNAKDFLGMPALEAAVVMGWREAAQALIARGADINMRNAAGRTPLHMAAAADDMAMVELLLGHGANTRIRDKDGNVAASLAKLNGHETAAAAIRKWQEKEKRPSRK